MSRAYLCIKESWYYLWSSKKYATPLQEGSAKGSICEDKANRQPTMRDLPITYTSLLASNIEVLLVVLNMAVLQLLLMAAAAGLIIYFVSAHIRQETKAKSRGCQPAPLFRPWDILGVQNFNIEIKGMKTNRLSFAFLDRKNEISAKIGRNCKTFRIRYPLGETWYYTFDPKNLQAVLATQFRDFQQPAARVGAFEALLGLGIVCSAV